jgi:hypothetical protein
MIWYYCIMVPAGMVVLVPYSRLLQQLRTAAGMVSIQFYGTWYHHTIPSSSQQTITVVLCMNMTCKK